MARPVVGAMQGQIHLQNIVVGAVEEAARVMNRNRKGLARVQNIDDNVRRMLIFGLVVLVALVAFTGRLFAQSERSASVPFAVGEELVFHARFGKLPAGTARMRVDAIDTIRGRPAYHVIFAVDGGIPLFRVHDRYESWIDVVTLSSLRYTQQISEGRYHRETTYEFYPERAEYRKNDEAPQASVANPLDDGSFIYAARIAPMRVGDTVVAARYFMPEKNPVVFIGDRLDTVTVGAGTFATTLVRPRIKTNGIFSESGDAQVWFSNDERRVPVQVRTKFSRFSLTLTLETMTIGDPANVVIAKGQR